MLEATGGPAACVRCGRPAPAGDDPAWGGRFHNGRLIALACPACLDPSERAEIAARGEARLWEVVTARRARPADLRGLADADCLARLDPGAQVVGLAAGEPEDGGLDVVWVGSAPDGAPVAFLARLTLEGWAGLEEVYVPERARRLARALLDRG